MLQALQRAVRLGFSTALHIRSSEFCINALVSVPFARISVFCQPCSMSHDFKASEDQRKNINCGQVFSSGNRMLFPASIFEIDLNFFHFRFAKLTMSRS